MLDFPKYLFYDIEHIFYPEGNKFMDISITTKERRIYRAEVRLIGMLLRSPTRLARLAARFRPLDFADYRHQLIWASMLRLCERGEQVRVESVLAELCSQSLDDDAGGSKYLNYLARKVAPPGGNPKDASAV